MPVGFRIASAWVDIRAEDKGLRQQIKEAVEKATRGQDAKINLKIDSKGLRREVENALKEATKGQKPTVAIGIKSTGLRREVTDALKRATDKQKPTVKLGISSTGLRAEVQRALTAATKDQKPTVKLSISSVGLRGEVQRALTAATAGQSGDVTVRVNVDGNRLRRALADASGDAQINPDFNLQGLRQSLNAAIRRINVLGTDDVTVNTNIDGDAMRNQIRSEIGRLRDRFRVRIDPDISTDTFAARLRAAARTIPGDIDIPVNPRIDQLRLRAETAAAMRSIAGTAPLTFDVDRLRTRVQLMASLRAAQAGLHITVPVRLNRSEFDRLRQSIGSIEQGFRAIEGPTGRYAHIIAAIAATIGPAFALADHSIRTTGASMAVLVPMFGALTTGLASFMVGTNHMGAVISGIFGGSKTAVQALNDNMDQLSSNARVFANDLMRLQPAFTQLREDVQDTMFDGLDASLNDFTSSTLPVLRRGLSMSAMGFRDMSKSAIDAVDYMSRMGTLDAMFGGLKIAMDPIVKVPGQFLEAWVKTSIAATPLMTRMTTSFGQWSTKMSDKLNTAFENGRLQLSISRAGDTIVQFFRRIANNPEFQEFVNRMKESGPRVAEAFSDIAKAILKIINALAPISSIILTVVDAFAKFINALPTIFLDALIIKLLLFKAALGVTALVKGLAKAMVALRIAIAAISANNVRMIALLGPALENIGMAAPGIARTAAALGIFIRGALLIGGVMFMFRTLGWALDKAFGIEQSVNVDKLTKSILEFSTTGKLSGYAAKEFKASWADSVDGMDEKFGGLQKAVQQVAHAGVWDHFFHGFQSATQWIIGGQTNLEKYKSKLKGIDEALAELQKQGRGQEASDLFEQMAKQANKAGTSTEKFKTLLPKYTEELKNSKIAQEAAAKAMGAYGAEALKTQAYLDENRKKTDALKQAVLDLSDAHRQAAGDEISYHQTLDATTETIKSNMKGLKDQAAGLDVNSKKGQENRRALLDLANTTSEWAQSTLNATGKQSEATKIIEDGREQFIKLAEAAGATTTEAKKLADQWLQMPNKTISFNADVEDVERKIKDAQAKVDSLKQKKKTAVGADKKKFDEQLDKAQEKLDKLKQKRKTVIQAYIDDLDKQIDKAQKKVDSLKQKKKTAVGADKKRLVSEINKAQKKVDDLKQKRKVAIEARDATGKGISDAKSSLGSKLPKSVKIPIIATFVQSSASTAADAIRKQAERFEKAAKGKRYGGVIRRASGGGVPGAVVGPGGPTSDKIHAMLSNGEFVIRASAVQKYGLGFMNALNQGQWPRFAAGGAVTGSTSASAGSSAVAGGTTGTFTVKDATGKPVASALNNFKALKTGLSQAYLEMQQSTQAFGTQFGLKSNLMYKAVEASSKTFSRNQIRTLSETGSKSQNTWNAWKSGMSTKTDSTYKSLAASAATFQRNHTASTSKTSSATQNTWSSWKSGMVKTTHSTYSSLNSATSSFSKQAVSRIGGARDGMGSAWKGLSPRFKPPVSYLIHTVLNTGLVGSMNAMMKKLGGGKSIGGVSVPGFATGGPIYGPGTATSDSIPARLSNGEFVIQARAVNKFGTGFFNMLNQGRMPHDGAGFKPGFAQGGLVGFASGGAVPSSDELNKILGDGGDAGARRMTQFIMDNYVMPLIDSGTEGSAMRAVQKQAMTHIQANVQKFVKENFGGAGSAAAGLRWAKTQYGKPYQWGGNGNPSWDCSGFMSAIESVIRGEKPHRRWATMAFSGATAPPGWKLNAKAPFMIGITNAGVGHTAGTIGKENVESSGGIGVHGGVGVPRGYNDGLFTARYGYVGPNASKKATGGLIRGAGTGTSDSIPAWLSDGEYVIRAAAAKKLGTGYLNALNSGHMPGFASGGSAGTTYKIKYGDTLSEIAVKFHTTVSALMALNKTIKNANKIYAGATLVIKKATSSSGGSTSGGSSSGSSGFSLSTVSKAPKGDIQDSSAQGTLKGFVTLSQASLDANKAGANIHSEIENALGKADSSSELMQNIYDLQSKIKGAFKGKTETTMLSNLTKVTKALTPLQKNLDGLNDKLEDAQSALDSLKDKFTQLHDSVSDNIMDYGKVTKIGTYGTSPTVLLTQLQKDVTKSQDFQAMLEQLKAKGVNSDVIGQIADAGISGGGFNTAATILQMTPEQLAQLDSLQKQLTTAADKAGTAAAQGMYQAGIDAAQGVVDGLKSQQKAIEDQMMTIALAMEKAIKQALGIKSPSRVMMKVADYTADGLNQQLLARTPGIAKVMENLVTVPTPTVPGGSQAGSSGTIKTGSHGGNCVHIEKLEVNVNGTFDLNTPAERRKLAKNLVKEIKEEIRLDDKKRK